MPEISVCQSPTSNCSRCLGADVFQLSRDTGCRPACSELEDVVVEQQTRMRHEMAHVHGQVEHVRRCEHDVLGPQSPGTRTKSDLAASCGSSG